MTDDDLEPRLRRLLDTQAGRVEPTLSGPRLRHRAAGATRSPSSRVRRFAPALAAATAVVLIAGTTALLGGDDDRTPTPVRPGGSTSTTAPSDLVTPTPSTDPAPSSSPRHRRTTAPVYPDPPRVSDAPAPDTGEASPSPTGPTPTDATPTDATPTGSTPTVPSATAPGTTAPPSTPVVGSSSVR